MDLQQITLGEAFCNVNSLYSKKTALVFRKQDYIATYEDLFRDTAAVARALVAAGVCKGDHIGIWSHNCPQWLHLMLGAARIGAVVVTFNTSFKQLELEYQLRHSDCKILFYQKAGKNHPFEDILGKTLDGCHRGRDGLLSSGVFPELRKLVCLQSTSLPMAMSYPEFLSSGAAVDETIICEMVKKVDFRDTLCILYTSGTTGQPKGVQLSHFSLVNNALAMLDCFGLGPEDAVDICLPVFHSFAFCACVGTLLRGATVVMQEAFSPAAVLSDMKKYLVTCFIGVPTIFVVLTSDLKTRKARLPCLKTVIIGGAPCPEALALEIERVFRLSDIRVGYGITECSPYCFLSKPSDSLEKRTQTVGCSHEHMEARIVDELNRPLPPGVCGELVVRGYNLMKGYYKNEAETSHAVDHDGWFHTGDAADMDAEGYIRILDRIKDMIIRGGENVYTAEVESILCRHPGVRAVSVVGVPDYKYGEEILAYVVSRCGEDVSRSLIEFARENMADFKVPKYVVMIDNLPINASGKVQKFLLREMAGGQFALTGEHLIEQSI